MTKPTRSRLFPVAIPLLLLLKACSAGDAGLDARAARETPPTFNAASGCGRLTGREASAAPGLIPMGMAGPHALYGEPRRMLCSEPGAGGEGECELVAPTTVRIKRGGESWGYRAEADSILRYGPAAVTCRSRTAAPAASPQNPPATPLRPPVVSAPEAFYGSWIVSKVRGRPMSPRQSPILIQIDSGRMFARADCAHLGQLSYVAKGATLVVGAPPPRLVEACARGLSLDENAFREVFERGATARLVDGALVLERAAGEVRAARTLSSPDIKLPLLPPSPLGDAAVLFGVLSVEDGCLYVRTAKTGERVLPALMQPAARDPATGMFHFGRAALVPGSEVRLGGSMKTWPGRLEWAQAPDPACDQSKIWVTVSMDESPAPW